VNTALQYEFNGPHGVFGREFRQERDRVVIQSAPRVRDRCLKSVITADSTSTTSHGQGHALVVEASRRSGLAVSGLWGCLVTTTAKLAVSVVQVLVSIAASWVG